MVLTFFQFSFHFTVIDHKVARGGDVRPWIGEIDKIARNSGWLIILDVTLVHTGGALVILGEIRDASACMDILDEVGLLHPAVVSADSDDRPWIGDLDEIGRKSGWLIILGVTLVHAVGVTLVHAKVALDMCTERWDAGAVLDVLGEGDLFPQGEVLDKGGLLHHAEVALDRDVQPWIGDLDEFGAKNFTVQRLKSRKGVGSFSI